MKKIIVVTKCTKTSATLPGVAQFSFKGHYMGHKISSLQITHESFDWKKDEEYVIYLGVLETTRCCLRGKAIKIKLLSEFLMES